MGTRELVIILFLLAAIAVAWQLIMPAYNKITAGKIIIGQNDQKIQELNAYIERLEKLIADYQKNEESIEKFYDFLPQNKDIAGILNEMEFIYTSSGLILNSIDFSETAFQAQPQAESGQKKAESGIKALKVSTKASGAYDSFKILLDVLEQNIRLIDIRTIGFSAKGQEGELFDFQLAGDVYYVD